MWNQSSFIIYVIRWFSPPKKEREKLLRKRLNKFFFLFRDEILFSNQSNLHHLLWCHLCRKLNDNDYYNGGENEARREYILYGLFRIKSCQRDSKTVQIVIDLWSTRWWWLNSKTIKYFECVLMLAKSDKCTRLSMSSSSFDIFAAKWYFIDAR